MPANRQALIEAALEALQATAHRALTMVSAEWLQSDLSMAQMKALCVLAQDIATSIGALSERLGVGASAGSHIVERLVQAGLAERHEDVADRRRSLVRLTPHGQELARRGQSARRELLRGWLRQMTDDDLAALIRGLTALATVAAGPVDEQDACLPQRAIPANREGT